MSQTPDFNLTTLVGFNTYAGKNNQIIGALRTGSLGPNPPLRPIAGDEWTNSVTGDYFRRNLDNSRWQKLYNIETGVDVELSLNTDSTLSGAGTAESPLSVTTPLNKTNVYNQVKSILTHDQFLNWAANDSQDELRINLNTINLQTAVLRSAKPDGNLTTADRGKFLKVSKNDQNKLALEAVDEGITTVFTDLTINGDGSEGNPLSVATPYSTSEKLKLAGYPTVPSDQGKYELKVASDGTTTWAEATGGGTSEATTSGAIQVASSESKTYSVAAGTSDLPQSTLFNITIEVGADSKSIILRGSDLVGGQTTRIGNRTFQIDFASGTGLRTRISAGNAVAYEWVFAYGDVSGGTEVKTNATLIGNGSTATPLAVANPFTEAEKTKLANLSEDGASSAEVEHLRVVTSDINLIAPTVEYGTAPAAEAQWTAYAASSAIGQRLIKLAERGGKLTNADLDSISSGSRSWHTSAAIGSSAQAIVVRIAPELTVTNYALAVGNVDGNPHRTHSWMAIGSSDSYLYYAVGRRQTDLPSDQLTMRKQLTSYISSWKGGLTGPAKDQILDNKEKLIDIVATHATKPRTVAQASRGGWSDRLGQTFYDKTIAQLQAGLTREEIAAIEDGNVNWLQSEIQEQYTALIVRLARATTSAEDYVVWTKEDGVIRLDATNQIYQDTNYTYYRARLDTTGEAQVVELQVKPPNTTHTTFNGTLGEAAIASIGDVGGKPQGQLYLAFSSGLTQPLTSFRNDYLDLVLGSTASGSVIRHDVQFLLRGTANDLTEANQLKQITVAGQRFRNAPFTLGLGEFLNGDTQINSVGTESGLFNLFIPMTNSQWELITNNDSSTLDLEITYAVGGVDRVWRLRVPRLNATQRATNPLAPWIPAGAIIGGGGGGSSRTRLGGRSWNLDNSQNARYQDTGITIPAMENDDFLRIAVAHPSFSSKHTESYSWEFIKDLAMTGTVGGTASFNNTFSMGDAVDSGTPSPRVIFTLTNSRRLLVAFFLSGGNPVGGAVKIAAWKE